MIGVPIVAQRFTTPPTQAVLLLIQLRFVNGCMSALALLPSDTLSAVLISAHIGIGFAPAAVIFFYLAAMRFVPIVLPSENGIAILLMPFRAFHLMHCAVVSIILAFAISIMFPVIRIITAALLSVTFGGFVFTFSNRFTCTNTADMLNPRATSFDFGKILQGGGIPFSASRTRFVLDWLVDHQKFSFAGFASRCGQAAKQAVRAVHEAALVHHLIISQAVLWD